MESTTKSPISLKDLSSEERAQLLAEALEAQKTAKTKKNEQRETYKQLVEEAVPKAIFKLAYASETLSIAQKETFQFFEDILNLKNEVYGLKEKQRSHTFSCETSEITIGYRIIDGWDDTVHAGIQKVNTFITSLGTDEKTASLVGVVMRLLKKDANGNLKGSRVLELQKTVEEFNNEEFTDGVDIISKAFKPKRSSWFIEACITEDGKKTPIPLNISSVEFAEGYKFDFFSKEDKELILNEHSN